MLKAKKPEVKQTSLASDSAYKKLLTDCRTLLSGVEKNMIQSYWKLGALANNLRGEERAKYGEKTVENLSDDLDMSRSNLYSALKFHVSFTEKELSNALDKGLKWRHITNLLAVPDEAQRKLLVEKVSSEGLTSDQLKAEIFRTKKKAKGDRGRKKQFTYETFYKRITKVDTWLTDEFMAAFEVDEKAVKKAELKKLEEVYEKIGAILEKVRK